MTPTFASRRRLPRLARLVVGALVAAALVSCPAGAEVRRHVTRITCDRPGYWEMRWEGEASWKPLAPQSEGPRKSVEHVMVSDEKGDFPDPHLEIRFHAYRDLFHDWEATTALWKDASSHVDVRSTARLQPSRVYAVLGLVLGLSVLAVFAVRRVLGRRLQHATAALEEAQERLTFAEAEAGLFPLDGSLPRRIGPYQVEDRLGQGGMATVYRVRNGRGEVFALKLPMPQCLQDVEFRERFRRELKIGTRLMHPHLVRILDVNDGEGAYPYPYLVMELLQGPSLEVRIRKEGRLARRQALEIARQVLEAVGYIHARGIVHRDIKPSNIMLTGKGQARLMDFGVAHRADTVVGTARGAALTGSGEVLGTPIYMAPEQIAGRPADPRSDLYAVGVVVYEMLAGSLPYGSDTMQIIQAKMGGDLPGLGEVCRDVPPATASWVMRMVSPDPERRFQSAEDALRDLR